MHVAAFVLALVAGALPDDGAGADRAVSLLRDRWLFADRIDWKKAAPALRERWAATTDAAERAKQIVELFEAVNDVHSIVRAGDRSFVHYEPVDEPSLDRLRPLLERERAQVGRPIATIIEADVGYLLVPGVAAATSEEVQRAAGDLRRAIESIAPRVQRGWIVDVRLNGGGNLLPMLLGAGPLLGEGVVGGTRDRAGALVQQWVLSGDELRWRDDAGERVFASLDGSRGAAADGRTSARSTTASVMHSGLPLVVLMGPITRSSGQGLALAFVGRPRTTSVGEATARGYTTVTAPFELDQSLALSLAVGFMTDRAGRACQERVEPVHVVEAADRFDELERDAKVQKAVELLGRLSSPCADSAYDPMVRGRQPVRQLDLVVADEARGREIPLRVYLPLGLADADSAAKPAPAPVVLFSHGLGGSCRNNPYLGEHWAARGYAVVFMQHAGSDEGVWRDVAHARRMAAMRSAASTANFLLRVQDVPAVINRLERWNAEPGHELHARLDLEHIGMSGHSFGALTTQAVSGQAQPTGQSFTDPRIDAAVLMSPSSPRRGGAAATARAFAGVSTPWLLMTGTKDEAVIGDQSVASRLAVFPALPQGDKYELVLFDAEHSAFGDRPLPGDREARNPNHHRAILAITTAFWDAYLRGDPRAKAWLESDGPESGSRSVLQSQDRWQRK